jgi:heat shock protein HtpX
MEILNFDDEIRKNKLKSVLLIGAIIGIIILIGAVLSLALDPERFFFILIISIIISITYTLISYYSSASIALFSVHAQLASKTAHKQLYDSVENMSLASGLPMPKIYIMESEQINAFASGRNPKNAVICVTTGALKKLNKQELEGVIAHEMSHIANYDMRFMTLTAVLIGLIAIISEVFLRSLWFSSSDSDRKEGNAIFIVIGIILAILAPILANLVSLAISRKREFGADATGVKFTRYPPGLSSALKKIKTESVSSKDLNHYSKAMAPLFISDPFKKKLTTLFSTHPDIDERISRLNKM